MKIKSLLSLCIFSSVSFVFPLSYGCKEKYVVGIVPVYTEESRHDASLTISERINIEQGYHEAVRESSRYNKTVDPLYLQCKEYVFGFSNCSKALNPYEGWKRNVREFYAIYYFKRSKDIRVFMKMNGINLLIMSTYIKSHENSIYQIELKASKYVLGSDESVSIRSDRFWVPGFEDYEKLRLMSRDSLMRIMDQIEMANPDL